MARAEVVTYSCDVCGRREDGTKVQLQPLPAPATMIRPAGWGQLHLHGQDPEDPSIRHKKRGDFCSAACLYSMVDAFYQSMGYDDDAADE